MPEISETPPAVPRPVIVEKFASLLRPLATKFQRATGPGKNNLSIEERLTVGPKKMLMVVNCHGRRFLLATAGDTIAPLIEVLPIQKHGEQDACVGQSGRGEGGE